MGYRNDRRGFASSPAELGQVALIWLIIIAVAVPMLSRLRDRGGLESFAEVTPAAPILRNCTTGVEVGDGPFAEGAYSLFQRGVERPGDGSIVLSRSLDRTRTAWAYGSFLGGVAIWMLVMFLANPGGDGGTDRLDAWVDGNPRRKAGVLIVLGIPALLLGLGLLVGIVVLLPTTPNTFIARHDVVTVTSEGATHEWGALFGGPKMAEVSREDVIGVTSDEAARIVFRDDTGPTSFRIPVGDSAVAGAVACAVASVLQLGAP